MQVVCLESQPWLPHSTLYHFSLSSHENPSHVVEFSYFLVMDELPNAAPIESLFRDVYRILEDIQESAERLEPVAESLAVCHWTIQNLERLYRVQAQTHNPSISNDVFDMSRNLDRFIASCSALAYSFSSPMPSTELQIGCMFGAPRQTKKKNQIRELQEEFWDHQKMLSLVLSNAI